MYEFTEDCMLHIDAIDEEHKRLFQMINEAFELVEKTEDVTAIGQSLIANLKDYAATLIEYFKDTRDLFLHTTPVISFVAKPGTIMTPLIERLLPLLEREGLKVVHLIKEDSSVVFKNVFFEPTLENLSSSLSGADLVLTENFGADAPNKIEILRKYWSETPLSDEKDLIAVFADFPYHAETSLPVFDLNKPKNIVTFLREYLGRQ